MPTIRLKSLIALVAAICPVLMAAPAQGQHMNAAVAPCRTAGSGAAQSVCLSAAATKADAELNRMYQRVASVLQVGARQQLQDAERSWLAYRDQTCAAERNLFEGGTAGNQAYPACLEALTRHRIDDLKSAYWWKVEKFGG